MLRKPTACAGCPLHHCSPAYVPPSGPLSAALYLHGESAGRDECVIGRPFVGAAGGVLSRAVRLARRFDRDQCRIGNVLWCQPPANELSGKPYEQAAIQACATRYLNADIDQWASTPSPTGRKVLVALGGVPLRTSLGLARGRGVRVQDFHRTATLSPCGRYHVVPTFHPSHVQRGAWNLLGVLALDLRYAWEVSTGAVDTTPDQCELVVDPPPEWFGQYVDAYLAALAEDPWGVWLATDTETFDKMTKTDEGELTLLDKSYTVLRWNFATTTRQGVTVPNTPEYLVHVRRALASPGVKLFHHARYDVPRAEEVGAHVAGPIYDSMWMVHVLQSDLPRGLGFWAPYYGNRGPWKHWASEHGRQGPYAARDPVETLSIGFGAARELVDTGQWDIFYRHVYLLDKLALLPAEAAGVLVDRAELDALEKKLDRLEAEILAKILAAVPLELHPLVGGQRNTGLTRRPENEPDIVERVVTLPVQVCAACGKEQVSKSHRCEDRALTPAIVVDDRPVLRWFRREPFNPDSSKQVLRYIEARGHRPGKNKKSKAPSADKDTLARLAKTTRDPLYPLILDQRTVTKVNRTYVRGSRLKLEQDPRSVRDGRLHPTFLHKPSTLRLSCQSPNLTNVVADRGERTKIAAGFRRCIIAEPGCVLQEYDFTGIEAVITGWLMGDPDYMRLGALGVHGYVAARRLKIPVDLAWDDATLGAALKKVKADHPVPYDTAKRTVHGSNYGLSEFGMHNTYPELFPTIASARAELEFYYSIAPKLPALHADLRERAHRQGYLGGPGAHPFGYRHWFYNVMAYRPWKGGRQPRGPRAAQLVRGDDGRLYEVKLGEDAKRCVAFFPQSIAAAVIKEVMLRLFDPEHESYVGAAWRGRTPLRASIHDSLLLEVPEELADWVRERVVREMRRAIPELPLDHIGRPGEYLTLGVEMHQGYNWGLYDDRETLADGRPNPEYNLRGMKLVKLDEAPAAGVASDAITPVDVYDEEEDPEDLRVGAEAPPESTADVAI